MIRNVRYSADLTLRIVTGTTSQSFGTASYVETLDGGEVLYRSRVFPLGFETQAFRDALRWLEGQREITVQGEVHVAPAREFVGRVNSGAGFHVRRAGREIIRAVTVVEAAGTWSVEDLVPADSVPMGARRALR